MEQNKQFNTYKEGLELDACGVWSGKIRGKQAKVPSSPFECYGVKLKSRRYLIKSRRYL